MKEPRWALLSALLVIAMAAGVAHARVDAVGDNPRFLQQQVFHETTATTAADSTTTTTTTTEAAATTIFQSALPATTSVTPGSNPGAQAVTPDAQAVAATADGGAATNPTLQAGPAIDTAAVITPDPQVAAVTPDAQAAAITHAAAAITPDAQAAAATAAAAITPDAQAAESTTAAAAITPDAQAAESTTAAAAITPDAQAAAATAAAAITPDAQAAESTTAAAAITPDAQAAESTTAAAAITPDAQAAESTTATAAITPDAQAAESTTAAAVVIHDAQAAADTTAAVVTPDAQAAADTTAAVVTPDAQAAATTSTTAAVTPDALAEAATTTAAAVASDAQAEEKSTDTPKRPIFTPKVNQLVQFAPAVTVKDGDDITTDGKCKSEIESSCKGVELGEGKLAECMSGVISESESGEDGAPSVSGDCREEVFQFKISRNSNINHNVPLAKACKEDAEMFCNVTWFFGYRAGQINACLKDVKAQISKPCKLEVFKIMMDAAIDFRSDPVLFEACKEDSENICQGVDNGGGRIQACLRDKRMQLGWACEEQLFKQEMENADDLRLSVRLFAKCMPDKRKFCKDIEPGNTRTKECLEEHREELSGGCKDEIDAMIERRVHDFRLDPVLRESCEEDIFNMCAYYNNLEEIDAYDSSVVNCLQDFSAEIANAQCKEQVKKYVALAAQDIRFDVTLAEACYDDRLKFCSHVAAGSARVTRCLSNKRSQLNPVCRATLFDEEVRFSENIDFQAPMKAACEAEMTRFCKRVPHENGRVIRCLQDNKGDKSFGKSCREEVESYEAEIGRDYRLNYRLRTACEHDIKAVCPSICSDTSGQVCGGKVLRCLSEKSEELKEEGCRKEVAYFEKMEVSDFRNDILLAEACRDDVEKYCSSVQPGEGRVHKCLRDNVIKISKNCRKEELLLEEKEASSIELSPSLMRACKTERQIFCKDVAAGSARVFRCLAENVHSADFGSSCRGQVGAKLQRRQVNWRLDPPLRKACKADVGSLCAKEDMELGVDGSVYKCMVRRFTELGSSCQRELGRAVHMAFFAYQPGAPLTADCDEDVKRRCSSQNPSVKKQPGAVGACLANILESEAPDRLLTSNPGAVAVAAGSHSRRLMVETAETAATAPAAGSASSSVALPAAGELSAKCFVLADIAQPPSSKRAFDSSLSLAAFVAQLDRVGSSTGLALTVRDRLGTARGVSLTGWAAMCGVAALVLLVTVGVVLLYRRLRGLPAAHAGYTMVVKAEPK